MWFWLFCLENMIIVLNGFGLGFVVFCLGLGLKDFKMVILFVCGNGVCGCSFGGDIDI